MKHTGIKTLLLVMSICFSVQVADAAITLTDGYYSSSFVGCTTGNTQNGYACDGMVIEDDYTCGGEYATMETAGNYASGGGGNGWRIRYGTTSNAMTAMPALDFTTPQSEFWLRFYYRIASGQTIGSIIEHKIIYAFTNDTVAADVNWPLGANDAQLQPRFTDSDRTYNNMGWDYIYGAGQPANGTWHYFEFHFALGSSGQSNGVFQMWVDGVLVGSSVNMDWFGGGSYSPTGWTRIMFPHNHNVFQLAGCPEHDIDDVAVAIPGYSGFIQDGEGRNMIGAYSSGDTTAPSVTITTSDPINTSTGQFDIAGTASDAVGVVGCKYRVGSAPDANNGGPVIGTTSWGANIGGFSVGESILYIGCYDAAGLYGSDSITVNHDPTPPVISNGLPAGILSHGTTTTAMSLTTNEAATCKYSTTNTTYGSMPYTFSTTGGTSHSQTLTGLTNGSSYLYYVRCMDALSNANTSSTAISWAVSSLQDAIATFKGVVLKGCTIK